MAYYDPSRMKSGAADITNELKNYNAAKTSMDNIVNTLKNNWDSEEHTQYANKYSTTAKVSAENVGKLMAQFASVLEQSAEKFEELQKKAKQNISGQ